MTTLFDPLKIGDLTVKNRVFMAPLTRARAGESRVPNDLMAEYYSQRAGAGLIISEATAISAEGYGWQNAPAMYTDEQEEGWRNVVAAVHNAGGHIYLQLWHMGRVSHPDFLNGEAPFAPSAVAAEGSNRSIRPPKPYVTPSAMTQDDIKRTIEDYEKAALRAIRAGFDGVQIHGANGYLIDQFLRTHANRRDDEYGGSVENRARFMTEAVEAVTAAVGANRTAIRLSPENRDYNSMLDNDPEETFVYAAGVLEGYDLAFIEVKETSHTENGDVKDPVLTQKMREVYKGTLVVNELYDFETASQAVDSGFADAVAFGMPYIANPDLVERFKQGAPLNSPDSDTFYVPGAKGYTDYPFLSDNTKVSACS